MNMVDNGDNGGQLTVPPGFRFHPTDEELLNYYLKKKVAYEAIDLDVIREVDLNKLEPWDLKEKCRIGTGQQNEWYFFSHKDKKYPTGTRTNRATMAGFWKATGRDKPIQMTNNSKTIGMRKTLVFYTGRAPRGLKTDWIMHEYRLNDIDDYDTNNSHHLQNHLVRVQEDGWVVCRVFKKKNPNLKLEFHQSETKNNHHHHLQENEKEEFFNPKSKYNYASLVDNNTMHLPLLFSQESSNIISPPFLSHHIDHHHTSPPPLAPAPTICSSQNLAMSLTSIGGGLNNNGDWCFLDKLLASNQSIQDYHHHHYNSNSSHVDLEMGNNSSTQRLPFHSSQVDLEMGNNSSTQRLPFHYLGCETDILKYSNVGKSNI